MRSVDINLLRKNGKIIQILNDFVAKEEICNLSCDYCLTEGAALKEKHQFERKDGRLNFKVDEINSQLVYAEGSALKESIDQTLMVYNGLFDAPIFKISGGEVLLINKLEDLLKHQSQFYEVVQVLTNGTLFNEELVEHFGQIPNMNVQFSLDGHTLDMNRCRVKSEGQHQKLLHNLDLLVSRGITTEIYCVLSRVNMEGFPKFVEYLMERYDSKVHLAFFPVRQGAAKSFLPEPDRLDGLKKVIDNYKSYESILPPLPYLEEMYGYLQTRRRKSRCYVPLMMFQDFDDGVVTPCPNCWTVQIGNLRVEKEEVISNIGTNRIYGLMTENPPLVPFCVKCYTDYHLFNLYLNGEVSLEDLSRTRPLLQGPRVKERLQEFKQIFNKLE